MIKQVSEAIECIKLVQQVSTVVTVFPQKMDLPCTAGVGLEQTSRLAEMIPSWRTAICKAAPSNLSDYMDLVVNMTANSSIHYSYCSRYTKATGYFSRHT